MLNRRNTVFDAFFGTSLSSLMVTVLTFVSGVLITRVLGPQGRGEYGTVLLVAATVTSLCSFSCFDAAIVTLKSDQRQSGSNLPTMLVMAGAIILFALLGVVGVLPWLDLGLVEVSSRFFLIITGCLLSSYLIIQCFSAYERSRMTFMMVNAERVGAPAIFSLLVVAVWWVSDTAITAPVVLVLFALSKLSVIGIWLLIHRHNLIGSLNTVFARQTAFVGVKFHGAVVLGMLASQLDRLFILAAWPKDILGQYFVAFSAVGVGYSVISTAISTVLMPYLASLSGKRRADRIGQIIRLTGALILLILPAGWLLIPVAIPLLYGEPFRPAVPMAMGLLFAMAFQPLHGIIVECGRSLGKGRPSAEMAVASILTMSVGYGLTGFRSPELLIFTFGLSYIVSSLAGLRHMVKDGDIVLFTSFIPTKEDLALLRAIRPFLPRKKD